jgi:hypothetical protein
MRLTPPLLLLRFTVASAWAEQPPAAKIAPDDQTEAARAREAAVITRKAAESYTVTMGTTGEAALALEPKSLLQWSNPVSGSFHGSVFVWTSQGRPEVVASIYKWYSQTPHLGVELHSLAHSPVRAVRNGQPEWVPNRAGVELKSIPGAPAPAGSPAQRLRQMRDLAKEFTASETDRNGVVRELRLLTQPLYRYQSTDSVVLDGALFTFAEGTDTEIIMLIEARRGDTGYGWQYALARMNSVALRVQHRKREVWSVPTISWEQTFDPREPYTLFTFKPGQDESVDHLSPVRRQ